MNEKKVLVVDDVKIVFAAFERELGEEGFTVDTALNGRQALEKLASEKYDVIFMDIAMPGKDGIEISKEIKRNYPEAKIVLMTGKLYGIVEKLGLEFLKIGEKVYYLNKPFRKGEIIQVTREVLSAGSQ